MLTATTLLTQASISSPQDVQVVVEGFAELLDLERRIGLGQVALAEVGLAEGEVKECPAGWAEDPASVRTFGAQPEMYQKRTPKRIKSGTGPRTASRLLKP